MRILSEPDYYQGIDLNGYDQFGIKGALRYAREHIDDPNDPIMRRASELRAEAARCNLYHTNDGTWVLLAQLGR